MRDWTAARYAYLAYASFMDAYNGHGKRGPVPPSWDELPDEQKHAWDCAALAAKSEARPHADAITRIGKYPWLVVITREGEPDVHEFEKEQDARDYFDLASTQWSESYFGRVEVVLVRVQIGPIV